MYGYVNENGNEGDFADGAVEWPDFRPGVVIGRRTWGLFGLRIPLTDMRADKVIAWPLSKKRAVSPNPPPYGCVGSPTER